MPRSHHMQRELATFNTLTNITLPPSTRHTSILSPNSYAQDLKAIPHRSATASADNISLLGMLT
jgi:hypothetical protein